MMPASVLLAKVRNRWRLAPDRGACSKGLGWTGLLLLVVAGLWGGCSRISVGIQDEQKDPHYLAGKRRAASMDYQGAIVEYEKALQSNPNSASAHLELGLLYESEHIKDYTSALYHFQRHLKLRPNSNVAEEVRRRIQSCTYELARTVPYQMLHQLANADMERLRSTNALLRKQIEELKAQAAVHLAMLSNRTAIAVSAPVVEPNSSEGQGGTGTGIGGRRRGQEVRASEGGEERSGRSYPAAVGVPPVPREHTVRPGDTLYSIARQYGFSLEEVRAANPDVNPRRMRVGDTVKLPSRR